MTPGVLVIEGNARKLKREGHARIVDDFRTMTESAVVSQQLRRFHVRLDTAAEVALAKQLAPAFRGYSAVVLVAHGNVNGVELGEGIFASWDDAANLLAPVEPSMLFAVSCFAGAATVTDTLFERIPSLQTIIGSPHPLTTDQARWPMLEVLSAASGSGFSHEASLALRVGNFLLTEGTLVRRTRADLEHTTPVERLIGDVALGIIQTAYRNR